LKNQSYRFALVALCLALPASACAPQPVPEATPPSPATQSIPAVTAVPTAISSSSAPTAASPGPHVDVLDPTHLTLGDQKISSGPQRGYVFSCMTQFNGSGAQGSGPWLNGDGTWDLTRKLSVDGAVAWPHSFTINVNAGQRVFAGNDLPDHPTGTFPISPSDDAYAVDRNPNSIRAQSISFSVPADPAAAAQPGCIGGEVGVMLSGVLIFNAFDAEGHDAPAHEVQDDCDGHPQKDGFYHYHSLSDCLADTPAGHSALMGYAFDGFGIYGFYGEDGRELTDADLDECHGHIHEIEWDGRKVVMFHYHATREFPYIVGCFRGSPAVRALSGENAGQGAQPARPGGPGGQPPQEAIDACAGRTQNAACSFTGGNGGTIAGICQTIQSGQLACVPQGAPPPP
jgi:hypothetical protein